jgi:GTP1/Obg family GTP-binding protein
MNEAKRIGFRIQPDAAIKNTRNRVRKQGAERLNAVTLALCVPLRDVIQGYRKELRLLHPFERVVADLTVRARKQKDGLTLQDVLDDLNEARKEILIVGKEWIAKAKTADTARETAEIMVCLLVEKKHVCRVNLIIFMAIRNTSLSSFLYQQSCWFTLGGRRRTNMWGI